MSQLIKQEPPHRPCSIKPGLDAGLERIVLKCLAKEPEAALMERRALWRKTSAYGLAAPESKRSLRRFLAALSILLAALLLTGVVLAIAHWNRPRPAEPISLEKSAKTFAGSCRTAKRSRLSESRANRSSL